MEETGDNQVVRTNPANLILSVYEEPCHDYWMTMDHQLYDPVLQQALN